MYMKKTINRKNVKTPKMMYNIGGEVTKKDSYQVGDKIKYMYLNPQNPVRENVIAFPEILPPEFGLHRYIDNEMQFEKSFLDPAKIILDSIGWRAEEQSSLEDFFGA